MGLYGQVEWQVNSRLTLNVGLRWEWLPPFVDQHGIQKVSPKPFIHRRSDSHIGDGKRRAMRDK